MCNLYPFLLSMLYILYSSPAFILRNLVTEILAHIAVITTPKITTDAAVIAISRHVTIVVISGS